MKLLNFLKFLVRVPGKLSGKGGNLHEMDSELSYKVLYFDENDCKKIVGRYRSNEVLLVDHMENTASMKYAWAQPVLHDWLGCMSLALELEKESPEKIWPPYNDGQLLLTGKECPQQIGYSDFVNKNHDNL